MTERPMSHADAQLILTQLTRTNELLERLVTRLDEPQPTPIIATTKRTAPQPSAGMQRKKNVADAFIDERLEFTHDPDDVISTRKIYAEYLTWHTEQRLTRTETWQDETREVPLEPLELSHFGRYLTQHGAGKPISALVVDGQKVRVRTGVRFK